MKARKGLMAGPDNHYHMRCIDCGRVLDVDLPFQSEIEDDANKVTNCLVTGHKLEFTGLCPRCREGPRDERTRDEKAKSN